MAPRSGLYHHYVPRFILRYFAAHKRTSYSIDDKSGEFVERLARPTSCFIADSTGGIQCDGQLTLQSKTALWYLAQDRIHVYHLPDTRLVMASEHDTQEDFANTISRNFGFRGLYDDSFHREIDHIEKLFSKLESQAARVIGDAVSALYSKEQELRLTRDRLNALRKFLFLMGFRHNSRGQQFFDNSFDNATRKSIDHHLATQNFPDGSTARDVWLQNIKEILVTDYAKIPENRRILGLDRYEFVIDMRRKHLVFWRTSKDDEFITCNNGFGCMEGTEGLRRVPPSLAREVARRKRDAGLLVHETQDAQNGVYQWTRLFPVHPRLTIALVHNSLLRPDGDLKVIEAAGLAGPSCYRDLPMPPHRTTYFGLSPAAQQAHKAGNFEEFMVTVPQDGSLIDMTLLDGQPLESRLKDKFTFPLVPLSTEQTHRINGMFLENAGDALAFRAPGQLYRSIVAYERNSIWEHKRAYGPLKHALRMWSQSLTISARPLVNDSGERRMIWVASGTSGTNLRAWLAEIRHARREDLVDPGLLVRFQNSLVRTHDESLLRNEEAHRERHRRAPAV